MVAQERPPPGLPSAGGSAGRVDATVLAIGGRIGAPEIADLCARVQKAFARSHVTTVIVDVGGVIDPDIATLDALARLHLTATRMGRRLKVRHTCRQIEELAAFGGLDGVLLLCSEEVDEEQEDAGP